MGMRLSENPFFSMMLVECNQLTPTISSLVPRPHPPMRRNGLVNQVEFLGLAHTFATL